MTRTPYSEKLRIAKSLSQPNRSLQNIIDQQFPGQAARRRRREEEARLASITITERFLYFIMHLAIRAGMH